MGLKGEVRRIEPSGFTKISALGVEEQRVNVIIDFDNASAASEALGDGYRVEVRIVVWEESDVLKVPVSSLFRVGEEWAVYVIQNSNAIRRPITIGQRSGLEAERLPGLEQGQQVIIHPSDAVRDGARVTRRSEE